MFRVYHHGINYVGEVKVVGSSPRNKDELRSFLGMSQANSDIIK